ncbi:MAG: hypothetical protein VB141_12570 [Burkholderia gladioli]
MNAHIAADATELAADLRAYDATNNATGAHRMMARAAEFIERMSGVESAIDGITLADLEFWDRVFLSVLSTAIAAQGWVIGNKPVTSGDERVELAARWADHAIRVRRERVEG